MGLFTTTDDKQLEEARKHVVPGEVVSEEVLSAMDALTEAGCRIVGRANPEGRTVRCISMTQTARWAR